jgi:hypothetical protein
MENGVGKYRLGNELQSMEEDHLDLETQPLHGSGFEKDLELLCCCWVGITRGFFSWAGVGMGQNVYLGAGAGGG